MTRSRWWCEDWAVLVLAVRVAAGLAAEIVLLFRVVFP
jgi:hypothetical protein